MNISLKMNPVQVEHIGDAVLYRGDSLELLPFLPNFDAVVTDPPYGISYKKGKSGQGKKLKSGEQIFRHDVSIFGDDAPFNPEPWLAFPCIMWGANHYAQRLPHGRWLVWDKLAGRKPWDSFSDVEIAYQNKRGADRIFSLLWKGVCKGELINNGRKDHPAQKPIGLMEWCLSFVPDAETILDPYMGAGTTGVACAKLGRKFIGVEIEQKYFDIACRRVDEAYKNARATA